MGSDAGMASCDKYFGRTAAARRRDTWKEDRTGFTGTSLLIFEGGVSWNSYGKFPETGLSTQDSLSVGPACGCGLACLAA
jgi:hypothetical protein